MVLPVLYCYSSNILGLSVVSQSVRFYSHVICPVSCIHPVEPLRLAEGGFLVLVLNKGRVVGAVGKWKSLVLGISKGRWERWETWGWFSTVSTGLAFPRFSGCGLGWTGWPCAV